MDCRAGCGRCLWSLAGMMRHGHVVKQLYWTDFFPWIFPRRSTNTQRDCLQHQGQTEWVSFGTFSRWFHPSVDFAVITLFNLLRFRFAGRGDERKGVRHIQQHADAQSGEQGHRHRWLQYVSTCLLNYLKYHTRHVTTDDPLLSAAALTMQIQKPAGFVDTAHYPLLLVV